MITKKKLNSFELNSFQPFAHGIWSNGKIKIGDEETLSGRNKLIVSEFKKIILEKYTIEEIKNLTILDIGGYDGLISTQIEEVLPFKKIVCLEPRKKNFLKGKFVRNYLNLETKVEFINGNLNNIKEEFDIIFCAGVIHHMQDLNGFIKQISKLAKKSIFIENCSYNPKNKFLNYFLNKLNLKLIETKDIIYKFLGFVAINTKLIIMMVLQ
jgi:2-polyprenyl-3-methyl-5-hydroxy-6-metoxy-1,4-benzoquinol methylase